LTIDLASVPTDIGSASLRPESKLTTVLRDHWNEHAQEWIDWVRTPDQHDTYWRFHRARFLSLVPKPGELTLDIGCGEGRVARDLKLLDHRVLGVDWSSTMCRAAATHPAPSAVVTADAARLPLADESVDCAVAFMSLQDIDDMRGALKEIARVLADGRKLALAIIHPTYSASGRNPDDKYEIKRSYLTPELCISMDQRDGRTMTFCREHRPLQAYVNALLEAGFSIEGLLELTDDDERNPSNRVPMFLDILAVRKPREAKAAGPPPQAENTHHVLGRRAPRHGHDHRTGLGNPGHRRLERSPHSAARVLGAYSVARLSLGLGGLIVAASSLIALIVAAHLIRGNGQRRYESLTGRRCSRPSTP
jgi:SAM-dependent methyltransferase